MKTELHIIQTAFRLFLGKGFSEISTNEIIREAGTTKGGFYYFFKSREDLVQQVIEMYVKPYYCLPIVEMERVWTEKEADVPTKTLLWDGFFAPQRFKLYKAYINMDISFRDFYFLLHEGMKKYETVANLFAENTEKRKLYLRQILERGRKRGELQANTEIEECITMILAMQDGILALKVLDNDIDDEQKYRYMKDRICTGYGEQVSTDYINGGVKNAI